MVEIKSINEYYNTTNGWPRSRESGNGERYDLSYTHTLDGPINTNGSEKENMHRCEVEFICECYEQYMMFWEMAQGESKNMFYSRKIKLPHLDPGSNLRLSFNRKIRQYELYIENDENDKNTIVIGNVEAIAKTITKKFVPGYVIKIYEDGTEELVLNL
jgi:hypothetical protein